jgi:hypothetical protein
VNPDLRAMIQTLLTTSGPLGVMAVMVWLEVRDMGDTLSTMNETLAVCVADRD